MQARPTRSAARRTSNFLLGQAASEVNRVPGMDSTDFDLLVIGGGPGGSTAAAFARKEGLSVCLVEREAFPRFHIGESLLPMGNEVLKASGAWPKVEAGEFVRKLGAEFMLADGSSPRRSCLRTAGYPDLSRRSRSRGRGLILSSLSTREASAWKSGPDRPCGAWTRPAIL